MGSDLRVTLLLSGLLMGFLGHGARAVIGLKSMAEDAKALEVTPSDVFQAARPSISFAIGFLGGLAAALVYISNLAAIRLPIRIGIFCSASRLRATSEPPSLKAFSQSARPQSRSTS
jgi:hypothetical protein